MQKDSIEKFTANLINKNDQYAAKLNEKLNREFVESITQKLKGVNNANQTRK